MTQKVETLSNESYAAYHFDPEQEIEKIIRHMNKWFESNHLAKKVIVGISGGKDSSVAAALATKAFGPEAVLGVMMPNGEQKDLEDSQKIIKHLKIKSRLVNIGRIYEALDEAIGNSYFDKAKREVFNPSNIDAFKTNAPARLRMTVLYGISNIEGGVVLDTTNKSESFLGWGTLFGDIAGGYSPLGEYTVTEVREFGRVLGLPQWVYLKTPDDGMCGKSDEAKLEELLAIPQFSYERLDKLIRCQNHDFTEEEVESINRQRSRNIFKTFLVQIPHYQPTFPEAYYIQVF